MGAARLFPGKAAESTLSWRAPASLRNQVFAMRRLPVKVHRLLSGPKPDFAATDKHLQSALQAVFLLGTGFTLPKLQFKVAQVPRMASER